MTEPIALPSTSPIPTPTNRSQLDQICFIPGVLLNLFHASCSYSLITFTFCTNVIYAFFAICFITMTFMSAIFTNHFFFPILLKGSLCVSVYLSTIASSSSLRSLSNFALFSSTILSLYLDVLNHYLTYVHGQLVLLVFP